MSLRRRRFLTVMFLIFVLLLSGCWSRREIDDLAIVTGIALDLGPDNKVHMTIQLVKPEVLAKRAQGGGGGGNADKAYWLLESHGLTFVDAVRKFNTLSPRQLFLAHNVIIIFGEDLARRGIASTLDRISRTKNLRRTIWVMVAKGKAREVLEAELEPEYLSAVAIGHMIEGREVYSQSYGIDLKDFLRVLTGSSPNPVASRIELRKEFTNREFWEVDEDGQGEAGQGEEDAKEHINKEARTQGREQAKKSVVLTGAAVFKKDKLMGWFDPTETRGLLWIQGKMRRGIIIINGPEGEKMAFESIRSKSEVVPKIHQGKLIMRVKIDEENDFAEDMGFVPLTPENIPGIEKKIAAAIQKDIEAALRKGQKEYKSDIFGFGAAVHRKYPQQWKAIKGRWEELFPQLEVQVEVKSKIRRRGMSTEPPKPGGKE